MSKTNNTLHRALIIDADTLIRAVLESDKPVTPELLATTDYAGMEIRAIDHVAEYTSGHKLAEYTKDGKLRPILERVLEGLCPVPDGYELVDGELVEKSAPPEKASPTIKQRLDELETVKAQLATADHDKKTMQAKINALTESNEMYGDLIQELALVAYK